MKPAWKQSDPPHSIRRSEPDVLGSCSRAHYSRADNPGDSLCVGVLDATRGFQAASEEELRHPDPHHPSVSICCESRRAPSAVNWKRSDRSFLVLVLVLVLEVFWVDRVRKYPPPWRGAALPTWQLYRQICRRLPGELPTVWRRSPGVSVLFRLTKSRTALAWLKIR